MQKWRPKFSVKVVVPYKLNDNKYTFWARGVLSGKPSADTQDNPTPSK